MSRLTYQQKTWLLYILLGLLAYLLYKRSFAGTIALVEQTYALEEKIRTNEENVPGTEAARRELDELSRIVVHQDTLKDPSAELLKFISESGLDQSVAVSSFEPPSTHIHNNYLIHHFKIKLSGDFISLLKALEQIELKQQDVRVISSRFYTERITSINEFQLYAELTLQYITRA